MMIMTEQDKKTAIVHITKGGSLNQLRSWIQISMNVSY